MRWRHRLHSCVAQTQTHSQLEAYTQALVAIPEPTTTTATALCNVILGLERHQQAEMVYTYSLLYTHEHRVSDVGKKKKLENFFF